MFPGRQVVDGNTFFNASETAYDTTARAAAASSAAASSAEAPRPATPSHAITNHHRHHHHLSGNNSNNNASLNALDRMLKRLNAAKHSLEASRRNMRAMGVQPRFPRPGPRTTWRRSEDSERPPWR